ncbi:hypothetical protein [Nocardia sp. NPDC005745]|uniref:hypothetical protein n=1 Tax=Nocardia sp. NPDC005745 TaxID=3157061 RepID=UPI0033C7FAAD
MPNHPPTAPPLTDAEIADLIQHWNDGGSVNAYQPEIHAMAAELLELRARTSRLGELLRTIWKRRRQWQTDYVDLISARARIAELEGERDELRADADRAHGNAGALHARVMELRAQVTARDARIAELEAAQRPPLGYVVGWQHEGRTLLAFDELEVGILGDRARAYTDPGEAHEFLAEVAPEDPRTRFCVYELREATP